MDASVFECHFVAVVRDEGLREPVVRVCITGCWGLIQRDPQYSIKEICEIVGISRNTYYKYIQAED